MEYITGSNDTFNSIAQRYTGTTDFAETIAASSGMYSDVLKTPLNAVLEPGLLIRIPDSILPNQTRIEVIGGGLSPSINWKLVGIGIAVAVILSKLSK